MGPYAPQDLANLTQGCLGPLKWETVEVLRSAINQHLTLIFKGFNI